MNKWVAPIIFAILATVVSLIVYNDLPESLVMHLNKAGQADNWMAKPFGAFLMPVLILLIPATTFFSVKFEKDDNKRLRAQAAIIPVAGLVSAMLFVVHLFLLAHNLDFVVPVGRFTSCIAGLMFVLMGNLLPRFRQGTMQWPKTPEHVQRKVSRIHGRWMMLSGIAFLLIALLPESWIFPAFFVNLALFIIVLFGSRFYYARERA